MPGKMDKEYFVFVHEVAALIESARRAAAKSVNNIMTATYWFIGRRIVEQEQSGNVRAQYGEGLLARLAQDLSPRFGRGFFPDNLETMRMFYRAFPPRKISETLSRKLRNASGAARRKKSETPSRKFDLEDISAALPLSRNARIAALQSWRPRV